LWAYAGRWPHRFGKPSQDVGSEGIRLREPAGRSRDTSVEHAMHQPERHCLRRGDEEQGIIPHRRHRDDGGVGLHRQRRPLAEREVTHRASRLVADPAQLRADLLRHVTAILREVRSRHHESGGIEQERRLLAFGRELPKLVPLPEVLFVREGINSTVAVAQIEEGVRSFLVSARAEASSSPHDMRVQRMIGHVAGLLHREPRSVLVVGFGAGVTAGSFTRYPGIERIVICEIEPVIPQFVSTYFSKENYSVVDDPRVQIIYDDARHYLLTTREKFDIITSDPIHPWVKGAATLATREYFELVKRHLNPGGVVTQWVPFYESASDVVKSQLATFFSVFPRAVIFGNEGERIDSDTVVFAEADPQPIEPDQIQQRLDTPEYSRVKESLAEVGFNFAVDLLATYIGRAADLGDWLKDAQINTDRNLRLQYLAGMSSNVAQAALIYEELLRRRKFPEDLFIGSEETKGLLREALAAPALGQ